MHVLLRGNGDFTESQYSAVMSGEDERHFMLSLGLTTSPGCNMRCVYCYNEGGTREAGRKITSPMTWPDYEKTIREAAQLGAQSVIVVGIGETMMDKHFKKIIVQAHESGLIPLIFTNGSLIDRDMAQFLYEHETTVYFALDSTREDTFNRITRTRGLFPAVMKGIDHCLEAGMGRISMRNGHKVTDLAINAMVMSLNAPHIEEIEAFCHEKGVLFTCRFPEKLGTAPAYWQDVIASAPDEEEALKKVADRYSLGGEVFRTDEGCLFWIAGILLGIDGEARLCYSRNNQKRIGNIRTDSLRDIIRMKRDAYPPARNYFCPLHAELGP